VSATPAIRAFGITVTPDTTAIGTTAVAESSLAEDFFRSSIAANGGDDGAVPRKYDWHSLDHHGQLPLKMVGVRAGEFRSATRQLAEERVLRPYWKTVAVTLLAIAVSVGLAQAKHVRHVPKHHAKRTEHAQKNAIPLGNAIPLCAEGQQATTTCACGTDASGRPFMCEIGQWCRTFAHACTQ
jgi:hypothetical protein